MFLNTFSPTRSPNPEAGSWVVAPHQGRPFGTAQKRSWLPPLCCLELASQRTLSATPTSAASTPGAMQPDAARTLLGVTAAANEEQIKRAWREQALQWHPDKNGSGAPSALRLQHTPHALSLIHI